MDEILLLVLQKSGGLPVHLSTAAIGRLLGMSQQNASRRLIDLEKRGLLTRQAGAIVLTPKALGRFGALYQHMRRVFERPESLRFRGRITLGLGEGAYYLSLAGYRRALKRTLGFAPYPGTLNLRLDRKEHSKTARLDTAQAMFIPGFQWENRTLGGIHLFPCMIHGVPGAILRPVRTHHGPDILELIAAVPLKRKLKKKDGDWLTVNLQ